MRHLHSRRAMLTAAIAALALTLACSPAALEAYGDLTGTAIAIWEAMWTKPESDYEAIAVLSSPNLLAAQGDPPAGYVDGIKGAVQQVAAAWGIPEPYTSSFTLGATYEKPDGSGRIMAPYQFASPGGAYGVPDGSPVTGLCLEFEEIEDNGTPVPLLAEGYQVGDYVLPTTSPQPDYVECASGITPTPVATDTPTPGPGDGYEDDDPPNSSSIGIPEEQGRTLDPSDDVDEIHLWVWSGLSLEVAAIYLGDNASISMEIQTCGGTLYDTDGGEATISWTSNCEEVVIITVRSANGYYGPGETYILRATQL